jgi:hypothetical protein
MPQRHKDTKKKMDICIFLGHMYNAGNWPYLLHFFKFCENCRLNVLVNIIIVSPDKFFAGDFLIQLNVTGADLSSDWATKTQRHKEKDGYLDLPGPYV